MTRASRRSSTGCASSRRRRSVPSSEAASTAWGLPRERDDERSRGLPSHPARGAVPRRARAALREDQWRGADHRVARRGEAPQHPRHRAWRNAGHAGGQRAWDRAGDVEHSAAADGHREPVHRLRRPRPRRRLDRGARRHPESGQAVRVRELLPGGGDAPDPAGERRVRAGAAGETEGIVRRVSPMKKFKYYWEDFPVGAVREFGGRTLSKDDIIRFAREYDPQPFHVDEETARKTVFGGLIASGWQTCGLAMRMMCDAYLLEAASAGSPGVESIRWVLPVRPGDTLRVRL